MFATAYSTTAASSFYNKELNSRLILALAEGVLTDIDPEIPSLKALVDRGPKAKDIPPFEHPVLVEQSTGNVWIVDMRPYATRIAAHDGSLSISPDSAQGLLLLRAKVEMYWNQFPKGEMLFWGDIQTVVFARWISGLLKGRLNLSPVDLETVQVILGYYYLNLFYTEAEFNKAKLDNFAMKLNRMLGVDINKVRALISELGYMATLNDLVIALQNNVDNPAIKLVDAKYIYVVTMNSWFGSADAKALIAVALEFPPAFIAMVLAAGEKQFKSTTVGNAVEREKSRWRYHTFQTTVLNSLRSVK